MPHPLPTRLAASLLVLLYLAVGLTGQSAHYWLEGLAAHDPSVRADGQLRERQGYFHSHGSHPHWHYHSHEASEEEVEQDADETLRDSDAALRLRRGFEHEAHDCPLLSVVSHLKLSWAPAGSLACFEVPSHGACFASDAVRRDSPGTLLLPRGPPLVV